MSTRSKSESTSESKRRAPKQLKNPLRHSGIIGDISLRSKDCKFGNECWKKGKTGQDGCYFAHQGDSRRTDRGFTVIDHAGVPSYSIFFHDGVWYMHDEKSIVFAEQMVVDTRLADKKSQSEAAQKELSPSGFVPGLGKPSPWLLDRKNQQQDMRSSSPTHSEE